MSDQGAGGERPVKKRRDYMVRLSPHHAEKLEARARRANLAPAAYIRDRLISLLEGTDPQEFLDALDELRRPLEELAAVVRDLKTDVRENARPVRKLLARIRLREVPPDEADDADNGG